MTLPCKIQHLKTKMRDIHKAHQKILSKYGDENYLFCFLLGVWPCERHNFPNLTWIKWKQFPWTRTRFYCINFLIYYAHINNQSPLILNPPAKATDVY